MSPNPGGEERNSHHLEGTEPVPPGLRTEVLLGIPVMGEFGGFCLSVMSGPALPLSYHPQQEGEANPPNAHRVCEHVP